MGCYMNGFGESNTNKIDVLVNKYNAKIPLNPEYADPDSGKITVCVISNGLFDAVGVAYDEKEFNRLDGRSKVWLLIDRAVVEQFSALAEYLEEVE